jgi:hypothetical protein
MAEQSAVNYEELLRSYLLAPATGGAKSAAEARLIAGLGSSEVLQEVLRAREELGLPIYPPLEVFRSAADDC